MTPASGACAAAMAVLALTLGPATAAVPPAAVAATAGSGTAVPASAARLGYPDVPAALAAGTAAQAGGPHATPLGAPATRNVGSAGSLNWSGYAVNRTRVTFRSVSATFFVPYLNCPKSPGRTMASVWAGLDGYVGDPDTVEQIGVAADCSSAGRPSYFAWLEMYPYAQSKLPIPIYAGDSVTAQVSYDEADKDFRLTLLDNTRGEHITRLRRCPAVKVDGKALRCARNSAEVIVEAPASGSGQHLVIDHLSDYGAVSFAEISIADSAGQRGGVVSGHWNATKIVQLGSSAGPIVAEPTTVAMDMFDSYWLRED